MLYTMAARPKTHLRLLLAREYQAARARLLHDARLFQSSAKREHQPELTAIGEAAASRGIQSFWSCYETEGGVCPRSRLWPVEEPHDA